MKINIKQLVLIGTASLLLSGCFASKEELVLYKSKQEWVKDINFKIEDQEFDLAFEAYEQFHLEHPGAVKELKSLILKLADKYDQELEYIKSIRLLDIYLKKYATKTEKEDIVFKQIISKYNRLDRANHNYVLLSETIKNIEELKPMFNNKEYIKELNEIHNKLILRKSEYDATISNFYEKKGNEYGTKLYSNKVKVDTTNIDRKSYQPYKVWHSDFID